MNRIIPITGGGTYSMVKLLALASAANTGGNLQEDTVNFVVDTSEAPTTLILPEGIRLQNINVKFFVSDLSGQGATNPITIQSASEADSINGGVSVAVDTAYGSAWITGTGYLTASSSFSWITTFGGAASSNTGGVSGVSALTNGLTLIGSTGYLGGALIQNTTISGLETYAHVLKSTDGTFYVASGALSAAPYNLGAHSFSVSSTTTVQGLSLNVRQNQFISLLNTDTAASGTRGISLITSSAGSSAFPNGGLELYDSTVANYVSYLALRQSPLTSTQQIVAGISNLTLAANSQYTTRLTLSQTIMTAQKSQQNTSLFPINGWSIQNGLNTTTSPSATGVSALYYACTSTLTDSSIDLTSGSVLYLSAAGVQFIVSNALKFGVSPTGAISVVLPTSAGTSGTLWNDTSGTYGPSVVRVAP